MVEGAAGPDERLRGMGTGMNAPKLALVRTREQTIEECLASLVPVMADKTISRQARDAAVVLQRELHKCRSPETVARLEREQGLR